MGVSTKLLINPKYSIDHVEKLIATIGGKKKGDIRYHAAGGFIDFMYGEEERMFHVYRDTNGTCGIPCLSLSLNAWGSNIEIMTKIAQIVGGCLIANDCDDKCEMFQDPHAGFSQFVLEHQIIERGLTARDASELSDKVAQATDYKLIR